MIIVSIDPGADGSFAIIDEQTKRIIHLHKFDFVEVGNVKVFDPVRMISLCEEEHVSKAVIEKVGAQRGQGISSAFTFGTRFGDVLTASKYITDDIVLVSPQKWKSAMGLIGRGKSASAEMCAKIYPDMTETFLRPKKRGSGYVAEDGFGDAVLIGLASIKLGL